MEAYKFYLDGLLLPVTPGKLTIKVANKNKTIDLISGDVAGVIKKAGLSKITFSFLLPARQEEFAVYDSGFKAPDVYLSKLETLKQSLKPFLFQVLRDGSYATSFTVSLEDYDMVEDAKSYGRDVYVSVTLQQYKSTVTKTVTFSDNTTSSTKEATVSTPARDTTGKTQTSTYTIKSGDCLWNIAKKYLGNGSRWTEIYQLNKTTLEAAAKKMGRASSSNGHWIYPGTVLTLPSGTTSTGTSTAATKATTTTTATKNVGKVTALYTSEEATILAKIMYNEARGIKSRTEIACIAWTILNRFDAGYGKSIKAVATAKNQFAYTSGAKTVSDYGYDLIALAKDVGDRYSKEKAGYTGVGRVLPKGYYWYYGDGSHNYFFNNYQKFMACVKARKYVGGGWNYSLASPY